MSYVIRAFDATTSKATVEYSSGTMSDIILPIDEKGSTLVGAELDAYILSLEPRTATFRVANASHIEAMVVPATIAASATDEEAAAAEWERVREIREWLLTKSDFAVIPDSPISEEDRPAWLAYRQALRDITNVSSVSDITWPARPDNKEFAGMMAMMFGSSAPEAVRSTNPTNKKSSRKTKSG